MAYKKKDEEMSVGTVPNAYVAGKYVTGEEREVRDAGVRSAYAARTPSYDDMLAEELAYTAQQQNTYGQPKAAVATPKTTTTYTTTPQTVAPAAATPVAASAPASTGNNGGLSAEEIKQLQMYLGTEQTGQWNDYDAQRAGTDAQGAWRAYQAASAWDFGPNGNPSQAAREYAALYQPNDYAQWLVDRGEQPDLATALRSINGSGKTGGSASPSGGAVGYDPGAVTGAVNPQQSNELRDRILSLIDGYENREPFSYDPETDPLYSAYRKQYTREGQRATQDTLGNYAAMTGGMPSTAAVTAAQQAGDYYAAQMADKIPELYQLAYRIYGDEGDKQLQTISLLRALYDNDYSRERDAVSDARYADELAYQRGRDSLSDQNAEYKRQLERAQMLAELGDSSALYQLLGYSPAADTTPASTGGGGYSNGSLTDAQVREMQKWYGTTADGKWGPNSTSSAGGRSAAEAWKYYQANKGSSGSTGNSGTTGSTGTSRSSAGNGSSSVDQARRQAYSQREQATVDMDSVASLGISNLTSEQLAQLVASGQVVEHESNGKIQFFWR